MIIAVAGQKGGAGKTTLAVSLAAFWHADGRRVLLVDLDPQRSSMQWSEVADAAGEDAPSTVAIGDAVRTQLPALSEDYDVTVIDCPGRVARRVAGALLVADVALFPVRPSPVDVWALGETLEALADVEAVRTVPLVCRTVLNGADRRTGLPDDVREALEEAGAPPLLEVQLGQRIAYARALAHGRGAHTDRGAAGLEVRRLANELDALEVARAA